MHYRRGWLVEPLGESAEKVRGFFRVTQIGHTEIQTIGRFTLPAVKAFSARVRHTGNHRIPDTQGATQPILFRTGSDLFNRANEFMTGNQRRRHRQTRFNNVMVGTANSTQFEFQQYHFPFGCGHRIGSDFQGFPRLSKNGRFGYTILHLNDSSMGDIVQLFRILSEFHDSKHGRYCIFHV